MRSVVQIVVSGDSFITKLKKKWFHVDDTTDVISFPMHTVMDENVTLAGEIVINEEQVRRNADEYGVDFVVEMARVVTHGVLHLYGYTDDTKKGKEAMSAIEDTIVKELQ